MKMAVAIMNFKIGRFFILTTINPSE